MIDLAKRTTRHRSKIILRVVYILAILIYAYLLLSHISFYETPLRERPRHEDYRLLRPAGMVSHTYGVIGSAFMILMLTYTLRKRIRVMRNWGMLSYWLDIHIFFGIMGPLLIVLHTSFKAQGLVAVSFWSMVAVATSGIFGRYLYLQIPRNLGGGEIDIKALEDEKRQYTLQLQTEYGLSDNIIKGLEEQNASAINHDSGVVKALMTIVKEDALRPFKLRQKRLERQTLHNVPPVQRKRISRIARQKAIINRRIVLMNQIQQLFHYWHVIHKPFAIVMYTIMVVHIIVAVWTGYKWIF